MPAGSSKVVGVKHVNPSRALNKVPQIQTHAAAYTRRRRGRDSGQDNDLQRILLSPPRCHRHFTSWNKPNITVDQSEVTVRL
jgi:hypothetical protein